MNLVRYAAVASLVALVPSGAAVAGNVDAASGSYVDAIPLEVPAFHGLEPRLAARYDSSGANGVIGVGWELAGMRFIERASPGRGAPR